MIEVAKTQRTRSGRVIQNISGAGKPGRRGQIMRMMGAIIW
jgi:hypothetical protein